MQAVRDDPGIRLAALGLQRQSRHANRALQRHDGAIAARALSYGEKTEYSGPVFDSMKARDGKVVLRFTHVGGGFVAQDGELQGFTVFGEDQWFHPASAEIVGDTVVVSSPEVGQPAAVRYGWASVPEGNLFNREELPASPFRTDTD